VDIGILGIGYVGAVAAGCLSAAGHRVIAVDINPAKVDELNAGQSPLAEPGLPPLIAAGVAGGRLRATTSTAEAFAASDVLMVCVGTPGLANGRLDLQDVTTVAVDLGRKLGGANDGRRRTVVVRSTVLPGTMDTTLRPALEQESGLQAGSGFGLAYMPEFLREGQGVEDFNNPATIVLGSADADTDGLLRRLHPDSGGTIVSCDFRTAEAIKFTNNAFHAMKVAFANEVGAICKRSGIDGRSVMDIVCADTRLNISRAYLRPGFAFGGSCLPKDVRALCHYAQGLDVRTDLLQSLLPSNEAHIARAMAMITGFGHRRVALLGLTFKPDTDDLRHSPLVELAERLIGKGYDLRIFDPSVRYAGLMGRNRTFIQAALPHLGSLLVSTLDEALAHGDTVVVGHRSAAFVDLAGQARPDHCVLDLASGAAGLEGHASYHALCW
jgi:GDP-mannose 6-dehydrogenase